LLAAGLFLFSAVTAPGGLDSGDAAIRLATAESWLDGRGGALDAALHATHAVVRGREGNYYSFYQPTQSATMVPFVLVERALRRWNYPSRHVATLLYSLLFLPALAAATVVVLVQAARCVGAEWRIAALAAVATYYGSVLFPYTRVAQEENIVAFAYSVWLLGACRTHRRLPAGAFLMAGGLCLAMATRLASLPVVAILSAGSTLLIAGNRRSLRLRESVAACAVIAAAGIGLGAYNEYRFGTPFETGYRASVAERGVDLFRRDRVLEHALALLFSPGRGLVFYSPVWLVAAWETFRASSRRWNTVTVTAWTGWWAALIFAAGLFWWTGAAAWGPRYLVAAQALLGTVLAQFLARRARAGAIVTLLVVMQLPAIVLPSQTEEQSRRVLEQSTGRRISEWSWAGSGAGERPGRAVRAVVETIVRSAGSSTAPSTTALSPAETLELSDYQTIFWWPFRLCFRFGVLPKWAAFALVAAGIGAALLLVRRAFEGSHRPPVRARPTMAERPSRTAPGPESDGSGRLATAEPPARGLR
jgi:hypothetical protein